MSLFDINYDKLINWILPVRLRKPVLKAWLRALSAPVKYVYGLFGNNRVGNLYYLNHNSQVTYLQAVLNDAFDPSLRRIRIVDNSYIDPVYAYLEAEQKVSAYVFTDSEHRPLSLYADNEISPLINGFTVEVPDDLFTARLFNPSQMLALINKYRLASKSIINITGI